MRISDWSSDVCSSDLLLRRKDRRADPDGHRLVVQELVDPGLAAFLAEARDADAAEGRVRIDLEAAIIIDPARVQPLGKAVDALQVVRLATGGETIVAVVRDPPRRVPVRAFPYPAPRAQTHPL